MADAEILIPPPDPFGDARSRDPGVAQGEFHGERMLMLLRWKDVRDAARDPEHFDSSVQGHVPTPPEHEIRDFRQLPIETNPPEHGAWRDLVQPYFRRPMQPGPKAEFEALVTRAVDAAMAVDTVEAVGQFALPLQSAALAVLLDTDRAIAAEWQDWGLHAFRTNGKTDPAKAARFIDFIDRMLTRGKDDPAMGLFAALHEARFEGRPLKWDEMRGICHLALSGGRDTVIHAMAGTLAHMARVPGDMDRLRGDARLIPIATEEMFRVLSPLPMIGRVCPHGLERGDHRVEPGARAALCWAAANRDGSVFEAPDEIRIDRAPNPHVAFGAGAHTCLGAPMARLLVRSLLAELAAKVSRVEVLDAEPRPSPFGAPYLYEALTMRLHPT